MPKQKFSRRDFFKTGTIGGSELKMETDLIPQPKKSLELKGGMEIDLKLKYL